jgi:CRP-like cAMP-binding protein
VNDHAIVTRAWTAFDRLGSDARAQLEPLARRQAFEPGASILQEGRETPFLAAVESGRVALRLRTPELGARVTIATIEPGELLGWSALVPPFRATADATATERVELVTFDAAALRDQLASDPLFAAQLLPLVFETVSGRLTTSWHQLLDLFEPRGRGPW